MAASFHITFTFYDFSSAEGEGNIMNRILRPNSLRFPSSEFYWVREAQSTVPELLITDFDRLNKTKKRNEKNESEWLIVKFSLDTHIGAAVVARALLLLA
jgi:hypothetical protein